MARSLRNPNRCPTHPGAILREDVLPALGLTQKEFASKLAYTYNTDMLRNERVAILEQRGGYERIERLEAA